LLCRTDALEFVLVRQQSRLLLRIPFSFHFLQRLPPLRVLTLLFRQ
jgi:hypothetical protein